MRKLATLLLAGLLLTTVSAPVAAKPAGEHPGCKGIDQALSTANAKGRTALTAVAEKLDCGPVVPDPVDDVACPAGEASLARWTYTGSQTGPIEHGYPTWEGSFTLTSGTGVHIPHGDGGGFYWDESEAGSVRSIVLKSFTDEVVTLDAEDHRTPGGGHAGGLSQNVLVDRTGINLVNFCG